MSLMHNDTHTMSSPKPTYIKNITYVTHFDTPESSQLMWGVGCEMCYEHFGMGYQAVI